MSEDVVKFESSLSNLDDNDIRIKVQNFQTILHKEPPQNEIQINKQANNSKYIPISFLEMKLDEMFFGIWSTKNFTSKTIVNEEVGSIELWYFHPVAKTWLCRIGAGAVMIMQKSGSDITDIGAKIKNTMTKDFPHLKAECFRNACLSIGKSFGRDLNREFDDQYQPIIKEISQIDQKVLNELSLRLAEFEIYKDLHEKAIGIKTEFVKKGLPEKLVYETIKKRLEDIQ